VGTALAFLATQRQGESRPASDSDNAVDASFRSRILFLADSACGLGAAASAGKAIVNMHTTLRPHPRSRFIVIRATIPKKILFVLASGRGLLRQHVAHDLILSINKLSLQP
jgi:hypothetical protein